jgi:lipopolysaccharide/colanic/teichoic acid biosynthesis glycosyltransferase
VASTASRRVLDLLAASFALALTAPVQLLVALAVRLTSTGPVLHRARRVGRGGSVFTLYKFRSMRAGSAGPAITAAHDERITSVGRVIRRWKLDELPQLYNVVRGDMSVVGPRPEAPEYVVRYTDQQRRLLDHRPGITSPATLAYRDEEQLLAGVEDLDAAYMSIMADKTVIDLDYFADATLRDDLRVIMRTFMAILGRSGDHPLPRRERIR